MQTIASHIINDTDYKAWISDIAGRYRQHQIKAAMHVSDEMIRLYWSIGRDIVEMHVEDRWGQGVLKQLSADLSQELDKKGFSITSLGYMKRFYLLYSEVDGICPQVGGEIEESKLPSTWGQNTDLLFSIPWSHHKAIIDKVKGDSQKGLFFVRKSLQNQWGRAMLENMLSTDLYESFGKSVNNFELTLPKSDSDLARDMIKGAYNFGFAQISKQYNEADLKNNLVDNIQNFLMELGRGFSFVGKEYRICAAGKEKFIDLLFYVIPLHRYCVVEVKITEFDFPDVGQLAGYMGMVDAVLNTPGDNECVGLLICQSKNDVFVQYALSKISAPIGVAEYEIKQYLPTPEELEQHLKES